jgi:hypothetical protein
MSSDRIYLRFKGRVLGPLTSEKVREMVKRGQITRQHELSPDGTSWRLASEYDEFFPAPTSKVATTTSTSKVTEKAQPTESTKEWYAHFDDTNQGPVDESSLRLWIASGKVNGRTMIWKNGMAEWMEAGMLRPEWFSKQSTRATSSSPSSDVRLVEGDGSIESYAADAYRPRNWILLLAISGVIIASLATIGSSLLFISAASASGAGPIKALSILTTLLFFAACCGSFYIAILLFRVASSVEVLRYRQTSNEVQEVFQSYARFWKTLGIFVMTIIFVGFLLAFMFLALGVSLAALFPSAG